MFDPIRTRVLAALRVPAAPEPPFGAPGSVRVFRAGNNFYKLRLLMWGLAQVGTAAGIVFSLAFLNMLKDSITPAPTNPRTAPSAEISPTSGSEKTSPAQKSPATKRRRNDRAQAQARLSRFVERNPSAFFLIWFVEGVGVALYLLQLPITYAIVRLDWEMRWYIVTDRSLRIRSGVWRLQETTMSFANLQQVIVSQGPLQRLLGIADVKVRSAGGGGDEHGQHSQASLHEGIFHGVENASEIRDLILERLRQFREAGLGDPDDLNPASPMVFDGPSQSVASARELLEEARALRAVLPARWR